MLRVLTKSDIELLFNFYQKINRFDEIYIRQLYEAINETKIVVGNVINNNISSILISGIINNDYYLESILLTKEDHEEIKDLINYAISELRRDERGLNIIYDNFPYNQLMHEIMTENGFKSNFMNLICVPDANKIELIKPNIALNDKSDDVKLYIYKNLVEEIKVNDLYLGTDTLVPDISSIHLENTNVATIRDNDNKVIGTLRFAIVSDSLFLDSLYADNEETYKDLITLVKNLTNKNIEINIYPSRTRVINILENLGFKKNHTNYILKLN